MQGIPRENTPRRNRIVALFTAALALGLFASAASAGAVTIGQLAPGTSPTADCHGSGPTDSLQASVTSGTPYVVPAGFTRVTSWSTNAAAGAGQMFTFKVFRPTGVANQYKVVAHDGPRPLTASAVNTFAVNIAVQPGDVIGNNAANQAAVHNACTFEVLGENGFFFLNGDLADGASGNFLTAVDTRVNIAAGDDTPQTVIGGKKIKGTTAKFTFRSSVPGSSFQCKLDKHSYKSCSSPKKYKHLSSGKHKFKVRAVDAAGNADTTPAKKKFTI